MSVISFEELKKLSEGEEVEIHGFKAGERITVRLCRPSLMRMAGTGEIPNLLLAAANSLFTSGISSIAAGEGKSLPDTFKVMDCIARAGLVEPKYEDFERAGVPLTDQQLIDIFTYSQAGIKMLEPFRKDGEDTNPDSDGKGLPKKAKRNAVNR